MAKVTITLDQNDVGQVIDGLEVRLNAYERTAEYFEGRLEDDMFIIEEVRDGEEAERIAKQYKRILDEIKSQISNQ